MSQLYIHEDLARIQPPVRNTLCRQECDADVDGIRTKISISPSPYLVHIEIMGNNERLCARKDLSQHDELL